jgi:hypothetical protein
MDTGPGMDIDHTIDLFVDCVNSDYREPILRSDSPASVLVGEPCTDGFSDWRIKPFETADWIDPLEKRIGFRFPALYRSLVTRYIFPSFETPKAGIFLFGNTPEGTDLHELRDRAVSPDLSPILLANGYVEFAKPEDGINYDAICFDMNRLDEHGDCPIVQIEHEWILCDNRLVVVGQLAGSFAELIGRVRDSRR